MLFESRPSHELNYDDLVATFEEGRCPDDNFRWIEDATIDRTGAYFFEARRYFGRPENSHCSPSGVFWITSAKGGSPVDESFRKGAVE